MAGSSLFTLIDDIASVLDDVALMTKVAAKKTAGVLGDDLALNAQQVTGVQASRELPVVWAVAKGSMVNKAILVPAALLIGLSGLVINLLSVWLPQDEELFASYLEYLPQILASFVEGALLSAVAVSKRSGSGAPGQRNARTEHWRSERCVQRRGVESLSLVASGSLKCTGDACQQ